MNIRHRIANSAPRQTGFTLVEVLVAVTISIILLVGVIQIFATTKRSYKLDESLARLQENGRFATDILARDVRMAGFQGCANSAGLPVNNIVKNPKPDVIFDLKDAIHGLDNVGTTTTINGQSIATKAGTDVLTIRNASPSSAQLRVKMSNPNDANIQLYSNPEGWTAGDIFFITDCENADIFQATTVSNPNGNGWITITHASNVNTSNKLSKAYQTNAMLMRFESTTYFIAQSAAHPTNDAGQPVYSLWRIRVTQNNAGTPEELVEGVSNMQVTYGLDTDGNGTVDTYTTAPPAGSTTWEKVASTRIDLLADSVQPSGPTTRRSTYTYPKPSTGGSTTSTGNDRRAQQQYTLIVGLRNRSQ